MADEEARQKADLEAEIEEGEARIRELQGEEQTLKKAKDSGLDAAALIEARRIRAARLAELPTFVLAEQARICETRIKLGALLEQIAQPGIAAAREIVEAAQAEFDRAKLALDEAQKSYKSVAGPMGYARSMRI